MIDEIKITQVDSQCIIGDIPSLIDAETAVISETIVTENGEPIIAFVEMEEDTTDLLLSLQSADYEKAQFSNPPHGDFKIFDLQCLKPNKMLLNYREIVTDLRFKHLTAEYQDEFTHCIVNRNNSICYHMDSSNQPDFFNAIIMLSDEIKETWIVLPTFNLKFKTRNNYVLLFQAGNFVHGVTDVVKTSLGGYRYSIVYYNLKEGYVGDN